GAPDPVVRRRDPDPRLPEEPDAPRLLPGARARLRGLLAKAARPRVELRRDGAPRLARAAHEGALLAPRLRGHELVAPRVERSGQAPLLSRAPPPLRPLRAPRLRVRAPGASARGPLRADAARGADPRLHVERPREPRGRLRVRGPLVRRGAAAPLVRGR